MNISIGTDREYRSLMEECIELAKQSPRGSRGIRGPYVGAIVLDRQRKVVGRGYKDIIPATEMILHAERIALEKAHDRAKGGTIITTLEPCVHLKRSQVLSSCSDLIIRMGIKKVVIGAMENSQHIHSGIGMNYLRSKGIEVVQYLALSERIYEELLHKLEK